MKTSYTSAFKAQVVLELLKEKKTISQLAAEHKVHPNVLRDWKVLALKGLPTLFDKRDDVAALRTAHEHQIEDLYAQIGRLTTHLAWIKKNLASTLTRSERRALVEPAHADVPLTAQADILSLSRSSLYYQPMLPSPAEVAAKHRIDELYLEFPYYGARRMAAQLQRDGMAIDRKTARKYMQQMGLIAIYPGPNLSKRHPNHRVFPYLLRGVTPAYPNQVWGTDITYIRLRQGWMFLVVVLDWFSRYIVSWALDETIELPFVLDAARRALAHATPQIWNTDQGSHFTSPQFTQLVLGAGAQLSMDGKGRALDNVITERLWRTVKYDHVYLHDYASPREARQQLGHFLGVYNERRLHESLAIVRQRRFMALFYGRIGCPTTDTWRVTAQHAPLYHTGQGRYARARDGPQKGGASRVDQAGPRVALTWRGTARVPAPESGHPGSRLLCQVFAIRKGGSCTDSCQICCLDKLGHYNTRCNENPPELCQALERENEAHS